MNDDIKAFSKLCVEHGFSKRGKAFSRCVGDAVLQNISIAEKLYIYPFSEEYTPIHKKAPCIHISILSMYSEIPNDYITEGLRVTGVEPENFVNESIRFNGFRGFNHQVDIMRSHVFSVLDAVQTQKDIISVLYAAQIAESGIKEPHQILLCAPHILCGERWEAVNYLCGLYTQNWIAFHEKNDQLKTEGRFEEYIQKENEMEKCTQEYTRFLNMIVGYRNEDLRQYFLSNLNHNLQLAKQCKIAFDASFNPLLK